MRGDLFLSARTKFGGTYIIDIARMGVFPPGFVMKILSIHSPAESVIYFI